MSNWLKKIFCRCKNSVEIIYHRERIFQIAKCSRCGAYYFINLGMNYRSKISEDRYLSIKNDLDRFDEILKGVEDDER